MPYTASQAPALSSPLDASQGWSHKRVHLNRRSASHELSNESLRLYTGDFNGHKRSAHTNEVFLKLGHDRTTPPHLKHSRRLSLPAEEQPMITAPVMIRKKSGELVKSCVKKGSNHPTWPKYVHFDSQLEHVRHFLQAETPSAVLEDIEPLMLDTAFGESLLGDRQPSLKYPNGSFQPSTSVAQMISVESVVLSPDNQSLTGRVRVQNIAYHKRVIVRYTFDLWKTCQNVEAAYRESVGRDPQNNDTTTLFFAVQYNIDNREFWDNNSGMNYQIDILRPAARNNRRKYLDEKVKHDLLGAAIVSLSSSPPSLSSSPNLSTKTQFGKRYNFGQALSHVQDLQPNGDSHHDDHHRRTLKRTGTFPSYFSSIPGVTTAASLEDALSSHIIHTAKSDDAKSKVNLIEQHQQPQPFLDSIRMPPNANKPAAWTAGYFDLINKYCFYSGSLSSDTSGSTTPSLVDPASVYGEPLVSVLVNHNVIQG
ncbi:putative phosphatase regulatory subunit-domain-containing protein [Umbelopsis sp. AD052]|nr:putative phosphatase regulatory subunit-domain-containing protein [Umbelopsis sp. AD052]